MLDYFGSIDWVAVSSQFSAVAIAAYGLYKAVAKLIGFFRKK